MFKFLKGMTFSTRSIHFHKTGVDIPIDKDLFYQIWKIGSLHGILRLSKISRALTGRLPRKTIAFFPQRPGPWYNARIAAEMAGFKVVDDIDGADYQFVFSDDTHTELTEDIITSMDEAAINKGAFDISKSHVGDVFFEIFGYAINVDPATFVGDVVAKSEMNGTHDGQVIQCPILPSEIDPQCAYQKLIPTGRADNRTEDLRLLYIMNKPIIVFHKTKDKAVRFGMEYLNVIPKQPDDVFSQDEIRKISEFCDRIGLDFGALDILRSNADQKIYIVDVNKTGMPVMCLSLRTQLKAFRSISDRFISGLEDRFA